MKKNKVFKGQPGYFLSRKKKLLTGSLAGFLMMFLFFVTGFIIYGTPKNLFSVLAVITVLPTTKIYVQYMILPWKNNADREYLEKIKAEYPDVDFYAELLMTGLDKRYEITYLAIDKDENITAYSGNPKSEKELFSKAVVNFLNYYNFDAKVKLFTDIREFEKYLKKIETGKTSPTAEQKEHMEVVFEKVSIMSI